MHNMFLIPLDSEDLLLAEGIVTVITLAVYFKQLAQSLPDIPVYMDHILSSSYRTFTALSTICLTRRQLCGVTGMRLINSRGAC